MSPLLYQLSYTATICCYWLRKLGVMIADDV